MTLNNAFFLRIAKPPIDRPEIRDGRIGAGDSGVALLHRRDEDIGGKFQIGFLWHHNHLPSAVIVPRGEGEEGVRGMAGKPRKKQTEWAKETVAPIVPRLLVEQQAEAYLNLSAHTLQKLRAITPVRYTEETFKAALEKGGLVPIPYLKIGGAVRYDIRMLDAWIERQQVVGRLPEEEGA